jgi:hypothetical protein
LLSDFWPNSLPRDLDETWAWTTWGHGPQASAHETAQALAWWLEEMDDPSFSPMKVLPSGQTRWAALLDSKGNGTPASERARPFTLFPLPISGESPADPQGGQAVEWAAAACVYRGFDPWVDFPDKGEVDLSATALALPLIAVMKWSRYPSLAALCVRHPSATADRLNRIRVHGQSLITLFGDQPIILDALADKGMDFNLLEKQSSSDDEKITPITQCTTTSQLVNLLKLGADPKRTGDKAVPLALYFSRSGIRVAEQKAMLAHLKAERLLSISAGHDQLHLWAREGRPVTGKLAHLSLTEHDALLTSALVGFLGHHNKIHALSGLIGALPLPGSDPVVDSLWEELDWLPLINRPLDRHDFSRHVPICTVASHKRLTELCHIQSTPWDHTQRAEALLRLVNRFSAYPEVQDKILAGAWAVGDRKWALSECANHFKMPSPGLGHGEVSMAAQAVNRHHALTHPAWVPHRLMADHILNELRKDISPPFLPHTKIEKKLMKPETARLALNFFNHGFASFSLPSFSDGKNQTNGGSVELSEKEIQRLVEALPGALTVYAPQEGWVEWLGSPLGQASEKNWIKNAPALQPVWNRLRAEHRATHTQALDFSTEGVPFPSRRSRSRP